MGTEQSYPIGTVLTRKKPEGDSLDEVRVVGGGKTLVVTPNQEFGTSVQLDANRARQEYNSDIGDDVRAAQPTYIDPGPSPEQFFSDADPNTERRPEASAWRPNKGEDTRTEIESSTTDTGIPVVKAGELPGAEEEPKEEKPKRATKAKAE